VRILYVSHTHPPEGAILENVGGMQRVSQQLIRELSRKESVEVIPETVNVSGNKIIFSTVSFLVKQLVQLPALVNETKADVVLFSSMVTASLSYFLRDRMSAPMVTINHGRDVTLPNKLYQRFVPHIFLNLDGVISVSQATRMECIKRGMRSTQGVALPNGFDLEKLNTFPDKNKSRVELQKKYDIPLDHKHMLLTVGRKVKRKGHEWFIREVMPKLNDEVVYVTVGDGPELENVQRAAESSPHRDRIFLLGRLPDKELKQAYAASDVFIMPNIPVDGDMEGFGIVLLEANMAKSPAVASDLEGIKDVITQGKNGYRVPAQDAQRFSKKVHSLLNGQLKQFGDQSRRHVQKEFSWENVSQQYLNYLEDVVREYHHRR
jgi:phosphatidylinositol alpha-1,6-mannosyltransferase